MNHLVNPDVGQTENQPRGFSRLLSWFLFDRFSCKNMILFVCLKKKIKTKHSLFIVEEVLVCDGDAEYPLIFIVNSQLWWKETN